MEPFEFDLQVRYMEVDAQGVVFNAWYLTYFDEAFTAFLHARGLTYPVMLAAGYDVQLVRTEIDWSGPLRHLDVARITVTPARVGRTSFALDFAAGPAGGAVTCRARTTYVVVAADGSGKRPIPALILAAVET